MRLDTLTLLFAAAASAGDWTAPVAVLHEMKPCVSYRAKLDGDLLMVQATIEPGWHTFAMDNQRRATEKLAGKKSLGIDMPTEIKVTGLDVTGPWRQTAPKDFSKPDLRWFSWGFEQQALFVAKVRGSAPAQIVIRGQACTESICKNINLEILLPASDSKSAAASMDLTSLVPVS